MLKFAVYCRESLWFEEETQNSLKWDSASVCLLVHFVCVCLRRPTVRGSSWAALPSFSTFFYALHSLFSLSWCYCSTERERHAHWERLATAQQAPHRRLHPSYPVCGTISHPVVQRMTGYPAACMHTHVLNSLKVNILHYCWRGYFMPHCPCLPLPACIFLTRVHTPHGSSGSSQRQADARRTGRSMLWLRTIAV